MFMVVCIISSIPKVNHLSDMYTRGSQIAMNEKVQSSFKIQDGKLRIDRATVAFGMGVDCPDIQTIHYGAPNLVCRKQEERGGTSCSYLCTSQVNGNNTNSCRRKLLFQNFLCYHEEQIEPMCLCCDLCAITCECDS